MPCQSDLIFIGNWVIVREWSLGTVISYENSKTLFTWSSNHIVQKALFLSVYLFSWSLKVVKTIYQYYCLPNIHSGQIHQRRGFFYHMENKMARILPFVNVENTQNLKYRHDKKFHTSTDSLYVNWVFSKWPHFYRAYSVAVCRVVTNFVWTNCKLKRK